MVNEPVDEVIDLKKKLSDLRETEVTETFDEEIKVGDYVLMPSLNISGKVGIFTINSFIL